MNIPIHKILVLSSTFINSLKGKVFIIETIQLICRANQLVGFYTMATLAFNELISDGIFLVFF